MINSPMSTKFYQSLKTENDSASKSQEVNGLAQSQSAGQVPAYNYDSNNGIGLSYDQSALAQMDQLTYDNLGFPPGFAVSGNLDGSYGCNGGIADIMDPINNPMIDPMGNNVTGPSRAMLNPSGKYNSNKSDLISARKVDFLVNDPDSVSRLKLVAEQVEDCFNTLWFDDSKKLKQILSSLKPEERAALEQVYDAKYGDGKPGKLRKQIRSHMSPHSGRNILATAGSIIGGAALCFTGVGAFVGIPLMLAGGAAVGDNINSSGTKNEAFRLLNEGASCHPTNGAIALREAMEGVGTDEATVDSVLNNSSDLRIREITATYENMFGETLTSDIEGDFMFEAEDTRVQKVIDGVMNAPRTNPMYGMQGGMNFNFPC